MPTEQTELREKLAAIEHERWADWQKWCHQVLRENCPSAELEKVLQRWDKQIATPYPLLTAAEKASDTVQVDRYWPLIEAYIAKEKDRIRAEVLDEVEQRVKDKLPKPSELNTDFDRGYDKALEHSASDIKSILASLREEGKV